MNDFTPPNHSVSVDQLLDHLSQDDVQLNATLIYGLSDLDKHAIERIRPAWLLLDNDTKVSIIRHLIDVAESNVELHYDPLGLLVIEDRNANVIEAGIDLLWENESVELLEQLIQFTHHSYPDHLRSTAIRHLERYVLLGEYGEIPLESRNQVLECLLTLWHSNPHHNSLRGAVIECLGNASFEELPNLIEEAYASDSEEIRRSAVYAMGRTCDITWEDVLLTELDNRDAQMRYEAARACGQIETEEAILPLYHLVMNDEAEVQEIAIWAMGEIGGHFAQDRLENLAEKFEDDEELSALIEDAIAMASINSLSDDLDY